VAAKKKAGKKSGGGKKEKTRIQISFKGVDKEIRGKSERSARVPEGDYALKIVNGRFKEDDDDEVTGINWRFQIVKPSKYKGKTLFGYTHLSPESLWNLRNLIHAATGNNVAGKALDLDLEKLYGKIVGAAVEDDEYKDKIRSKPQAFFPVSELEGDSDDEEDDEDEEDDDSEEEEEDDEEDDDDEDLEDVEVESL
jgi:hypothetical protein